MHVLIGGGSGFIGSALTTALKKRGDQVTIISREPGIVSNREFIESFAKHLHRPVV